MPGWSSARNLIRYETVANSAYVYQISGIVCIRLNCLADMVDMPLRQSPCLMGIGLVALGFRNQSFIVHHVGSVSYQNEQVIEGGRRKIYCPIANRQTTGVQVLRQVAVSDEASFGL